MPAGERARGASHDVWWNVPISITAGSRSPIPALFQDTVNAPTMNFLGVNTHDAPGAVAPAGHCGTGRRSSTSSATASGRCPSLYRAARGTPSALGAVQTNDILGGLAVRGYNGSRGAPGMGQVMFKAAENWTPAANGTYLQFTTTPIGLTTYAGADADYSGWNGARWHSPRHTPAG